MQRSQPNIHLPAARKRLPARVHEPYWRTLERGRALGFRKVDPDRGFWVARLRPDDGGAKYEYESLGEARVDFDYREAKEAAEGWFKLRTDGVQAGEVETVEAACRAYVKERKASKGEATGHDADKRFERTVYGTDFGRVRLAKLRAARIREWRDGLDLKPANSNRTLTALKAALNLGVREKQAPVAVELESRLVKALPGGKKRRELFLDLKQRRALVDAADGALRDLLEGAALTGARAGELVNATVSQFEARTGSMTFNGKTGPRTVPLAPAAVTLFKRLCKGKKSADRIFTRDDGKPWAHSDWDELVKAAAKKAELPVGVVLYTLRHSFITSALQEGMTTLDVARLVGTSLMMIEKHYGHASDKVARERLKKVKLL